MNKAHYARFSAVLSKTTFGVLRYENVSKYMISDAVSGLHKMTKHMGHGHVLPANSSEDLYTRAQPGVFAKPVEGTKTLKE